MTRGPSLYTQTPIRSQKSTPNITLTNSLKKFSSYQLIGGKSKGIIRIIFQNMGGIGNALYQPIQHKLATLKIIITNEVI